MKMNRLTGMFACLFVLDCVISFGGAWMDDARIVDASATDPLNATYIVEGQKIRLINGRSETESAPGSATKTITSVFGKPVYGNIDGEGGVDAALILTYDPGGSGTVYYAAAALDVNGFYLGTRTILLGDRVAPQHISVRNGVIDANYATRRLDESMSAAPSVGTSKYLVLEGNGLKETVKRLYHLNQLSRSNHRVPVARAPFFSKKTIQPTGRNLTMRWKYRFFLNDNHSIRLNPYDRSGAYPKIYETKKI